MDAALWASVLGAPNTKPPEGADTEATPTFNPWAVDCEVDKVWAFCDLSRLLKVKPMQHNKYFINGNYEVKWQNKQDITLITSKSNRKQSISYIILSGNVKKT